MYDNIIDLQDAVIRAIAQALVPLRGRDDLRGIVLYAHDDLYANALQDENFEQQLRLRFDADLFYSLGRGSIELKVGQPAPSLHATVAIPDHVSFVLQSPRIQHAPHAGGRATLELVDGTGSLHTPAVSFPCEEGVLIRIGRGAVSRKYGQLRQNDVVIRTDDPNAELQRLNNAVSSAHADIVCQKGNFYLQAQPSGCRPEGGSATKIFRGHQSPVELRTSHMLYLLRDGDIIELGKTVCLRFTMGD